MATVFTTQCYPDTDEVSVREVKLLRLLCGVLIFTSASAKAEVVSLECQVVKKPEIRPDELYKNPPAGFDAVARELRKMGAVGVVDGPPASWVLDTSARRIVASIEGTLLEFGIDRENSRQLDAMAIPNEGFVVLLSIDRITGTATFRTRAMSETRAAWAERNGKPLPREWVWEQSCSRQGGALF